MLKNISPIISPELLKILMEMGHSDEIVIGDGDRPAVWDKYEEIVKANEGDKNFELMERFAFYDRARKAYAVIATGETAVYANIILKKGVVK